MLTEYPQATLADIYKSFFQNRFGPGHMITDRAGVKAYLDQELAQCNGSSMPYFENCGLGDNYVRVSLSTVTDSIISADDLLDAFIESANTVNAPTIEAWKAEWTEILACVPDSLSDFQNDKLRIDSLLASGHYAIHHSRKFNELYHPHYRVIRRDIFQSAFLPKIEAMKMGG